MKLSYRYLWAESLHTPETSAWCGTSYITPSMQAIADGFDAGGKELIHEVEGVVYARSLGGEVTRPL